MISAADLKIAAAEGAVAVQTGADAERWCHEQGVDMEGVTEVVELIDSRIVDQTTRLGAIAFGIQVGIIAGRTEAAAR